LALLSLGGCGSAAKRATAPTSRTTAAAPTVTTTGSMTIISGTNTNGVPPPVQAHAEVPAVFNVLAGGSLSPPTVSVPAALPVELTVVSRDGRRHTAVLRSPSRHALSVPAGGRASLLVSGLKRGTYALELDGADRAALVVGVAPGP
ncbi:MAG TPA: hypothetical protein VG228_10130, partial [Solirubrobacteraceae bacterium]|nr:hypothetical protein [Solirubrobacteraceae bacterium]